MRHIYADFIDKVATPARYLGGEYGSAMKDPAAVAARVCLAFPDVYEIGMSHMGTKIIYSLLNKEPSIWCERAFAPWIDMEAELRARGLPLCSLESQTPLSEFDVIGISLQYELTFTNALTILDLGGLELDAAARPDGAPLVLGGGPVATHPEPLARFFDAFFVGEAEEVLADLALAWSAMRRAGTPRREALIRLAERFPLYVPSLYATEVDRDTGMTVVGAPLDPRVPPRVRRAMVADLDRYPFPSDTPVPYAEAVFDRAGVEIARGCTEGCRFCQAGMIYRPVRERSPASILASVTEGVARSGYDETSLTCLSTADYSAITPLVRQVTAALEGKRVSLSVSSLRAYGLGDEILDVMSQQRISGLTFAPEAGTQRMRDVVNKNVTEAHVAESAERVFSRGMNRVKLYFMVGLPTETDEDVDGIAATGVRMLELGRRHVGRRAEVVVSVSSHVPKPHTPFQWAAQDSLGEIARKQGRLRDGTRHPGLRLKTHDRGISFVEGVMSRGDRRVGAAVEAAWRAGARFDGWDECFDLERWLAVFAETGIDTDAYHATRPVTARLPWDHIDVGLDDGFLLQEYRRAVQDRLSPPCGKVVGQLVHHSNLADAEPDRRKLVCYDCGVACDLSAMRQERIDRLIQLGATVAPPPREKVLRSIKASRRPPRADEPVGETTRIRLRYTKLGRVAFLGHLDTMRILQRLFRRADLELSHSRGFHPKPEMSFAPALSLGVASLGELVDVALEGGGRVDAAELVRRLTEVAPEGIAFTGGWPLQPGRRSLAKLIDGYDLLIGPAPDGIAHDEARLHRIAERFLAETSVVVTRGEQPIDVRPRVRSVSVTDGAASARLTSALGWDAAPALLVARVAVAADGSAKPIEVARALGVDGSAGGIARARLARLGFTGLEKEHIEMADAPIELLARTAAATAAGDR